MPFSDGVAREFGVNGARTEVASHLGGAKGDIAEGIASHTTAAADGLNHCSGGEVCGCTDRAAACQRDIAAFEAGASFTTELGIGCAAQQ